MKLESILNPPLILTESNNSTRSVSIDEATALKMISDNHMKAYDAYQKGNTFWRGFSMPNRGDIGYVNPSKHIRESAYTTNHYTVLMSDILQEWKRYPKRTKSIVGSTNKWTANSYVGAKGGLYVVLPADGARIGVCPKSDIWDSFPEIHKQIGGYNMNAYNELLDDLFVGLIGQPHRSTVTLSKFRKLDRELNSLIALEEAGDEEEYGFEDATSMVDNALWSRFWVFYKLSGGDLIKFLGELMSPTANGFKVKTIENLTDEQKEVWTDAECVLVKEEIIDSWIKKGWL